jgi:hypothetical protein
MPRAASIKLGVCAKARVTGQTLRNHRNPPRLVARELEIKTRG